MLLHGPYAKKRCDCTIFFQVSRFLGWLPMKERREWHVLKARAQSYIYTLIIGPETFSFSKEDMLEIYGHQVP